MRLIKSDHLRKLQLAGVPEPVARPVDIDQSQTGFTVLRSLRIYCFNAGSVIDGHAEEDEVMIVILAGSVQLTMSQHEVEDGSPQFNLSAVGNSNGNPCVAYLPPNGAYQLLPLTNVEVGYARATTSEAHEPRVFFADMPTENASERLLFEEESYAMRLRLRIVQVKASENIVTVMPLKESETTCEALVHVRTEPEYGVMTVSPEHLQPLAVESWNTVCVLPGETPALHIVPASTALLLVVSASAQASKPL